LKALLGSKLIGWGLVAAAVFVISQAASGPKKENKNTSAPTSQVESGVEESADSEVSRGGAVQSEKSVSSETVPVLTYHYISSYSGNDKVMKSLHTSATAFDGQMAYLKNNGYKVLSLDEVYKFINGGSFPGKKSVALTFNDGYSDFYKNAHPILAKYGFTAGVFIITNRPGEQGFVSWSQLKKISQKGYTIGSQSVSNPNLTKVASARAKEEAKISKADLEGELGIKIKYFAYPYGAHNSTLMSYLKSLGYWAGFTMDGINSSQENSIYAIPRKTVEGGISLSNFTELVK